jgi:hypothetical protein
MKTNFLLEHKTAKLYAGISYLVILFSSWMNNDEREWFEMGDFSDCKIRFEVILQ